MRLLLSSTHGTGHVTPLLPFAHAAHRAGHDVLLAGPPPIAPIAAREGLPFHPLAWPREVVLDRARAKVTALQGQARIEAAVSDLFIGGYGAAALPGMLALVETWRPDAILHETAEVAAAIAGDAYDIPTARAGVALATPYEAWWLTMGAETLDAVRAEHGLPLDPGSARALRTPLLTQVPAVLDVGQGEPPIDVRRFRAAAAPDPAVAPAAPRGGEDADRPYVPVSFGTAVPVDGHYPSLYRAAVDALEPLGVRTVVTVGRDADPAALGALPAHVRVAPWVPLPALLAGASAFVTHGGAGTTLAALAHGIPMAVVPMSADQPLNAQLVAAQGAGIAIEGGVDGVAAHLHDAVARLLSDRRHGDAARTVADAVAALPPIDDAVAQLEAMALAPVA